MSLIAMLWKEQGVMVLGVCVVYDVVCVQRLSAFQLHTLLTKVRTGGDGLLVFITEENFGFSWGTKWEEEIATQRL